MKFSSAKKKDARHAIIDFPYDDNQEIKVCLKVLPVIQDLSAAVKAREFAADNKVPNPTEKDPEYSLTSMAEVVYRCTYECVKKGEVWEPTDNRFFSSVDEIVENLDQDLLVYIHEYYQNFKSLNRKDKEFTAENVAVITHVMGGEGSAEDKANFFCSLPRYAVYSYMLFTGKALLSSLSTKSEPGLSSSVEPIQSTQD